MVVCLPGARRRSFHFIFPFLKTPTKEKKTWPSILLSGAQQSSHRPSPPLQPVRLHPAPTPPDGSKENFGPCPVQAPLVPFEPGVIGEWRGKVFFRRFGIFGSLPGPPLPSPRFEYAPGDILLDKLNPGLIASRRPPLGSSFSYCVLVHPRTTPFHVFFNCGRAPGLTRRKRPKKYPRLHNKRKGLPLSTCAFFELLFLRAILARWFTAKN